MGSRVFNWMLWNKYFRNSKVTIGDNSVNTNYSLYVNNNVKFSVMIMLIFNINNEEKMRIIVWKCWYWNSRSKKHKN